MQRDKWNFRWSIADVGEAADKQAKYHREREKYWKKEQQDAKKKLEDEGITIEEFEVTGGVQHQAQLDVALKHRLDQAQGKVVSHQNQAAEFERWAGVMKAQAAISGAPTHLELDWADIGFFKLGE